MSDFIAAVQLYGVIQLLGWVGYPLGRRLFVSFPDQGWALSKILGFMLAAWFAWILSALHLVPFSLVSSWISVAVTAGLLWFGVRRWFPVDSSPRSLFKKSILWQELIFAVVYFGWTWMRGYAPDLNSLEKYMDYGFLLSALKTAYMPPLDHFLAGSTINYYYYGHYLAAFMAQLSQVRPTTLYNLEMSLIFGLLASISFSIVTAWLRDHGSTTLWWIGGVLASIFVAFGGNLHALVYLTLNEKPYWYPDATRFIPNTIHEFPIYSFIVNDLHGHVSNMPHAMLLIALLGVAFTDRMKQLGKSWQELQSSEQKRWLLIGVVLSFVIGTSYATNAWDFAIYLVLMGLGIWLTEAKLERKLFFKWPVLLSTASRCLFVLGLSVLFYLPFWIALVPISKGVGIVPMGGHSPPWQVLILWGVHLPILAAFMVMLFKTRRTWSAKIVQFFSRAWGFEATLKDQVAPAHQTNGFGADHIWRYVLLLMGMGALLVLLPELIFIRDIYPGHYRANTMFKFYYQAWLMLGLATAYATVVLWRRKKGSRTFFSVSFRVTSLCLVFAALLYTAKATQQGLGLGPNNYRRTIDGIDYLKTKRPGDYDAIEWLNAMIPGQPTILEAVGDSYTDYARVATYTGMPAVMGWPVHEWLWRGTPDRSIQPITRVEKKSGEVDFIWKRVEEVKKIYETEDVALARKLLDKYFVKMVYVGPLEHEKYPTLKEDKFAALCGPPIYNQKDVRIYNDCDRHAGVQ